MSDNWLQGAARIEAELRSQITDLEQKIELANSADAQLRADVRRILEQKVAPVDSAAENFSSIARRNPREALQWIQSVRNGLHDIHMALRELQDQPYWAQLAFSPTFAVTIMKTKLKECYGTRIENNDVALSHPDDVLKIVRGLLDELVAMLGTITEGNETGIKQQESNLNAKKNDLVTHLERVRAATQRA